MPAFAAAAAVLGRELTVPEVAQSVVLTRMPGRASAMPEGEKLAAFAATGATLVIHLAIQSLAEIVGRADPGLRRRIVRSPSWSRASWPERAHRARQLGTIMARRSQPSRSDDRTAIILVGRALAAQDFRESALYDPDYRRRFRGAPA